ncbi:MAG: transcriptional regulator [Lachnospiraceae bacterium]|nr:transcriptional regulator [Lachnospiraceae bacterium]
MVDFGNRLKTLRIRSKMTQAQLAQKLGLTKSVISAYETGLRLPSYEVLIHISKIFTVSTDYLLGVETKNEIDLSGLTPEEVDALRNLIKAMRRNIT